MEKNIQLRFKIVLLIFFLTLSTLCYAQDNLVVDVTRHSVIPNDDGDDSPSIQQLINSIKAGATLFFPAGIYFIDEPIDVLRNKITLKGEEKTVFKFRNKGDYYKQYGQRVGMVNIGANNVTVDNIYFDQNYRDSKRNPGDEPLIGCILMGCSYKGKSVMTNNITITNCTIYDYYGDGISVFRSRVNNFTVANNHLISAFIAGNWDDCRKGGEQGINVATGSNIDISHNKIEGAIDDAIATHFNNSNVTVADNDITTIRGRILVNGITNGLIKNNSIEYLRDGWAGILITMAPQDINFITNNNHVVVEDNKIHINKGLKVITGIMLYGPGVDITIRNNTITTDDLQPAGIQLAERLFRPTKTYYFGDSIRIEGNTIVSFATGIRINVTSNVKEPLIQVGKNIFNNCKREVSSESTSFKLMYEKPE